MLYHSNREAANIRPHVCGLSIKPMFSLQILPSILFS